MASSQDVLPGDVPVLPVDAEVLKKHTRLRDVLDLRATCDLVPPLLLRGFPEFLLSCCIHHPCEPTLEDEEIDWAAAADE